MESKIIIKDLKTECLIGEREHERIKKQEILIDIELYFNITKAVNSDMLKDTIDYDKISKDVRAFCEKSKYYLIESLAVNITNLIANNYPINKLLVRVKKHSALKHAKYVACEVWKQKEY